MRKLILPLMSGCHVFTFNFQRSFLVPDPDISHLHVKQRALGSFSWETGKVRVFTRNGSVEEAEFNSSLPWILCICTEIFVRVLCCVLYPCQYWIQRLVSVWEHWQYLSCPLNRGYLYHLCWRLGRRDGLEESAFIMLEKSKMRNL